MYTKIQYQYTMQLCSNSQMVMGGLVTSVFRVKIEGVVLQNTGILQHYTTSQPRGHQLENKHLFASSCFMALF